MLHVSISYIFVMLIVVSDSDIDTRQYYNQPACDLLLLLQTKIQWECEALRAFPPFHKVDFCAEQAKWVSAPSSVVEFIRQFHGGFLGLRDTDMICLNQVMYHMVALNNVTCFKVKMEGWNFCAAVKYNAPSCAHITHIVYEQCLSPITLLLLQLIMCCKVSHCVGQVNSLWFFK